MEGAFESADSSDDTAVEIAEGCNADSASEGGGVVGVLSVEGQRGIHDENGVIVLLFAVEHVEEIGGGFESGFGSDRVFTVGNAVSSGCDGCGFGSDADRFSDVGVVIGGVFLVVVGVESGEDAIADFEHIHLVSARGTCSEGIDYLGRDGSLGVELGVEIAEFGLGGELAFDEQVGGFFERSFGREIVDVVATVFES